MSLQNEVFRYQLIYKLGWWHGKASEYNSKLWTIRKNSEILNFTFVKKKKTNKPQNMA
jgi:hypothetical protein